MRGHGSLKFVRPNTVSPCVVAVSVENEENEKVYSISDYVVQCACVLGKGKKVCCFLFSLLHLAVLEPQGN